MRTPTLVTVAALTALLAPAAVQAVPIGTHVVISEVQTRGSNGGNDEFIELLNPTCNSINIGGWTIDNRSSTASSFTLRATIPANTILGSGKHYLLTNSSSPGYDGGVTGDQTYATGNTDAGVIRLMNGATLVDAVGFAFDATTQAAVDAFNPNGAVSANNLPHNNTTAAASNSDVSLQRKVSGTQDTDNDANDFASASPVGPENLASVAVQLDCPTPSRSSTWGSIKSIYR